MNLIAAVLFQFIFIPFLHVMSLVEDRHHSFHKFRVIGSNHMFAVARDDFKKLSR